MGVFIGYDTPRPMGKGMTGGHVAAPIFGNFMKMALADKKAVPFRIPPGIKLVRVSLRTGHAGPGRGEPIPCMEAFKPYEEPDDAYSVVGFTNESGGFFHGSTSRTRRAASQAGAVASGTACCVYRSAPHAYINAACAPAPRPSPPEPIPSQGTPDAGRSRKTRRCHPPIAGLAAEASLTGEPHRRDWRS